MTELSLHDRVLAALTDYPQSAVTIADTAAGSNERQRVQPMLNRLTHAGLASVMYRGRGLVKRAYYVRAICSERSLYCYRVDRVMGSVDVRIGEEEARAQYNGRIIRRFVLDVSGAVVGSYFLRYTAKQRVAA